ncbi:MAG: chromate resistance protein [Thermoproteota archaeon]|nr:chromate resistance protein [Thermoproteota archaeon]
MVRSADTPSRALTPQSEGLAAIATGFSSISLDDYDNMAKQCYVYDALFA